MSSDRQHSARVLVVDDNPDVIEFVTGVLRTANYDVRSAVDGDQALEVAESFFPDVVFLDIAIPEQDGWLVCSKLKMQSQAPAIVLITGYHEDKTDRFANFVHADELLRKPFSEHDILRVVESVSAV